MRPPVFLVVLAVLAFPSAYAGCYRGRLPTPPTPLVDESHSFSWRWRPAREPKEGLPESFSWANVKGRSMVSGMWEESGEKRGKERARRRASGMATSASAAPTGALFPGHVAHTHASRTHTPPKITPNWNQHEPVYW